MFVHQGPIRIGVKVYVKEGKTKNPKKNPLSKFGNQQQTQRINDAGSDQEMNPGHLGGKRALSPQHQPDMMSTFSKYLGSSLGGVVASWLVRSTPGRAVWVRALAGDIALCS